MATLSAVVTDFSIEEVEVCPLENEVNQESWTSSITKFFQDPNNTFIASAWAYEGTRLCTDEVGSKELDNWFGKAWGCLALPSFLDKGSQATRFFFSEGERSLTSIAQSMVHLAGMVSEAMLVLTRAGFLETFKIPVHMLGGVTSAFYSAGRVVEKVGKGQYLSSLEDLALLIMDTAGFVFSQTIPLMGMVIPLGGLQFAAFTCFVALFAYNQMFSKMEPDSTSLELAQPKNRCDILKESSSDFFVYSSWLLGAAKEVGYDQSSTDYVDLDKACHYLSVAGTLKTIPKLPGDAKEVLECLQKEKTEPLSWAAEAMTKVTGLVSKICGVVLSMHLFDKILGRDKITWIQQSFGTFFFASLACQEIGEGKWTNAIQKISSFAKSAIYFIGNVWIKAHLSSIKFALSSISCLAYTYDRFYSNRAVEKEEEEPVKAPLLLEAAPSAA